MRGSMLRNGVPGAGAVVAAIALIGPIAGASGADPLIEFTGHGSLENTGSIGGTAFFQEDDTQQMGFGEGLAGEGAGFDNTAGGAMRLPVEGEPLAGLRSFTFSTWVKSNPSVVDGGPNVLFADRNLTEFRGWAERMRVRMEVLGSESHLEPMSDNEVANYDVVDEWLFVAFSVDGISGDVKFYYGTESGGELLIDDELTGVEFDGLEGNDGSDLFFGNRASNLNSPFVGLLDNIRLHGSFEDGGGALSEGAIDAMFQDGLAEIPEPTTGLMLAGAGAALLLRRRRVND